LNSITPGGAVLATECRSVSSSDNDVRETIYVVSRRAVTIIYINSVALPSPALEANRPSSSNCTGITVAVRDCTCTGIRDVIHDRERVPRTDVNRCPIGTVVERKSA
jgi:hypothetical protein